MIVKIPQPGAIHFLLPFIAMPSIIAIVILLASIWVMLCSTFSLFCGHNCIIYGFNFCMWVSSCVATCISSMHVHTGMFTDITIVLMALTFMLIPPISWSLFSLWLLQNSQYTVYKSRPGLYMMCTLYWCILSIIHCSL